MPDSGSAARRDRLSGSLASIGVVAGIAAASLLVPPGVDAVAQSDAQAAVIIAAAGARGGRGIARGHARAARPGRPAARRRARDRLISVHQRGVTTMKLTMRPVLAGILVALFSPAAQAEDGVTIRYLGPHPAPSRS